MARPKVHWIDLRNQRRDCHRAEVGLLGPCRAEILLRYPPAPGERWEVTLTIDIPDQERLTRSKTYKRLPMAAWRFDEFEKLAARHMAAHCPTH